MNRIPVLRAICAVFLATAMSAPMAQVGSMPKGSVVAVNGIAGTLRLPKAAGKVSKVGPAGTLVPSAPNTTFVAQGNRRISLCYLNKAKTVTCTPVVRTDSLNGIDVGYMQKGGYTLVRFSPTKAGDKRAGIAAKTFMAGLRRAAAVLERHAARHIGDLPMPSAIDTGGGADGNCNYGDDGELTCTGSGGGGDSIPGGVECADCTYPDDPESDPPADTGSVPATNANEPCTASGDSIVCVMSGPRLPPLPMPTPTPAPGTIPPVGSTPPDERLPSGPAPWLPTIDWCQLIGLGGGPIANEGPSIPGDDPAARIARKKQQCVAQAKAHKEYCIDMAKFRSDAATLQCVDDATVEFVECIALAERDQP